MARFTLGQLKLAFSWHIAKEIVEGDVIIDETEEAWLAETFPRDTLVDAGFLSSSGEPTVDFESALGQALVELPDAIGRDEKLEIITQLFQGTLVDDDFHHEEGAILVKAAQLLGLTAAELNAHLANLDDVGDVEDDLLEDDDE